MADAAKMWTTYKRADGELVSDEWGWTTDEELCRDEADNYGHPLEFVEEVWELKSTRTLMFKPYGWEDGEPQDREQPDVER